MDEKVKIDPLTLLMYHYDAVVQISQVAEQALEAVYDQ